MSGSIFTTINDLLKIRSDGRENREMMPKVAMKLKSHINGSEDIVILVEKSGSVLTTENGSLLNDH
jgi:hypothetical protein